MQFHERLEFHFLSPNIWDSVSPTKCSLEHLCNQGCFISNIGCLDCCAHIGGLQLYNKGNTAKDRASHFVRCCLKSIVAEDENIDTYGRERIHAALNFKYPDKKIQSEHTIYCIMEQIDTDHFQMQKPQWYSQSRQRGS